MYKPKLILEKDLPIKLVGKELDTGKDVFAISAPLNSDISLSLKASGYKEENKVKLADGTFISGWMKV